jgi:hypothetical protein
MIQRRRLTRWQWFAAVFTAAGMLALLVFLIQVGLSEAVAISTVLSLFVAVAALLVSVLSISASRDAAERPTRTATKVKKTAAEPGHGEPAIRKITLVPPEPLAGATALLAIALCTFASDSLFKYSASWPWWFAAAATFLGFVAASSGVRADLTLAGILIFNTLWFFSYSVIIIEYRQTSSHGSIGQLATLSWAGAAANALFLITLIAWNARSKRSATSRERQPILIICLAIGMGLTAIALRGSSNVPWDLAGWIFIAALVTDLALLIRAPARSRSTA